MWHHCSSSIGRAKCSLLAALFIALLAPLSGLGQPPPPPSTVPASQVPQVGQSDPFRKATQLADEARRGGIVSAKWQEALNEYSTVVRDNKGKNAEVSAEALLRSALLAREQGDLGKATGSTGWDTSHTLLRQLRDDGEGTLARQRMEDTHLLETVEGLIDSRNAADWKYQMIDLLVRLTGKVPAFSYAIALILLAGLVKVILLPLTLRQYKSMREMQRMQPYVKALQAKYQKAELQQKTMELYKQHGVNPFSGCLPSLLQIPFLIVIFNAIKSYEIAFGHGSFAWIGSAVSRTPPVVLGHKLFGSSLAEPDVILLALYSITMYVTTRMTPASDPQQQQQQGTMALMMSVLFFVMFLNYKWSSAFVLYWLALNGFSIWQQYIYVFKPNRLQAAGSVTLPSDPRPGVAPDTARSAPKSVEAQGPAPRVRPRKKKR